MYTVSILSQSTRQWRSIQVKTLSECVQLTLGLSTEWTITTTWTEDWFVTEHIVATNPPLIVADSGKRYAHALRALVQRWKRNDPSPVCWFRMSDSTLLKAHKAFTNGWVLVLDELDQ